MLPKPGIERPLRHSREITRIGKMRGSTLRLIRTDAEQDGTGKRGNVAAPDGANPGSLSDEVDLKSRRVPTLNGRAGNSARGASRATVSLRALIDGDLDHACPGISFLSKGIVDTDAFTLSTRR